jgi:hypothetical protein
MAILNELAKWAASLPPVLIQAIRQSTIGVIDVDAVIDEVATVTVSLGAGSH